MFMTLSGEVNEIGTTTCCMHYCGGACRQRHGDRATVTTKTLPAGLKSPLFGYDITPPLGKQYQRYRICVYNANGGQPSGFTFSYDIVGPKDPAEASDNNGGHAHEGQGASSPTTRPVGEFRYKGSTTRSINASEVTTECAEPVDHLTPLYVGKASSELLVTHPDNRLFDLRVIVITQDEPVNGLGDGDTAPDGEGVGTANARVRAERSGAGNGRVYRIAFTATDDLGQSCDGAVAVGVPHDQRPGAVAVDDGQLFDSTR